MMKKINYLLLLALLTVGSFSTIGQTSWDKYVNNPILEPGPTNWDLVNVFDPCIIYNGAHMMWFTGQETLYDQVGYASSIDGLTWTKYNNNPIMIPDLGMGWDNAGISGPSVIYDEGIYKMWYTGVSNSIYQIGYATSTDGISWTKYISNPVLTPDLSIQWEMTSVKQPSVFKTNGQYIMYYSGRGATGSNNKYQIGRAVSNNGTDWIKETANPILTPGSYPAWDDVYVMDPCVTFNGQEYMMWYVGVSGSISQIGYATSADGITWSKSNQNPVVSPDPTNPWEEVLVTSPNVLQGFNEYVMYFAGKGLGINNKYQIGRASSIISGINNDDFINEIGFWIYPNPATDHIYVYASASNKNIQISISDVHGKVIYKENNELNPHIPVYIDISNYPGGVYYAALITNNKTYNKQFIISR